MDGWDDSRISGGMHAISVVGWELEVAAPKRQLERKFKPDDVLPGRKRTF